MNADYFSGQAARDEVFAENHGHVLAPGWTLEDLLAYLRTWTATRRLAQTERRDPILPLAEALRPLWGEAPRAIVWSIAMRAGRV